MTVDYVNHPPHYQTHGVECIVAARAMSFDLGNAVKYVYRAWDKGMLTQDLEKAQFYLKDHMAHGDAQVVSQASSAGDALRRIAQAQPSKVRRAFFFAVSDGRYGVALACVEQMIAESAEQD